VETAAGDYVLRVYRAGRYRAGRATPGRLEEQARRLLDLDRWLDGHGTDVVYAALRARPTAPRSDAPSPGAKG
jgi:hypothetical protein